MALKLAKAKGPEASKKMGQARNKVAAAKKALEAKEDELKKANASAKSKKAAEAAEKEVEDAKEALAAAEAAVIEVIESTAVSDPIVVDAGKDLIEYVGQPPFQTDRIYDQTPPGVVTGLAWTSMGGSTLYIECTAIHQNGTDKERGTLTTTGQLGDVMKESSSIAHTFAGPSSRGGSREIPSSTTTPFTFTSRLARRPRMDRARVAR